MGTLLIITYSRRCYCLHYGSLGRERLECAATSYCIPPSAEYRTLLGSSTHHSYGHAYVSVHHSCYAFLLAYAHVISSAVAQAAVALRLLYVYGIVHQRPLWCTLSLAYKYRIFALFTSAAQAHMGVRLAHMGSTLGRLCHLVGTDLCRGRSSVSQQLALSSDG